jgi:hypothetical protein
MQKVDDCMGIRLALTPPRIATCPRIHTFSLLTVLINLPSLIVAPRHIYHRHSNQNISCSRKTHVVPFSREGVAVIVAHLLPRTSRVSLDISFRVARLRPEDTLRPWHFIFAANSGFLSTMAHSFFVVVKYVDHGAGYTHHNRRL